MTPLEIGAEPSRSRIGEHCYDAISKVDQERLKERVATLLPSPSASNPRDEAGGRDGRDPRAVTRLLNLRRCWCGSA
jgi:hypothetical protein